MTNPANTGSQQLIVIDSRVSDWQCLFSDTAPPADAVIIVLDPSRDGLTQISEAVANLSNLGSIHIVSHGNTGSLLLGSTTLNSNNLSRYQSQLASIGNALSENGDILLYGCDVAQGDNGLAFINQLSAMTGADVAASTDLTGNASKGGDWVLEAATGAIEAPVLVADSYTGLLLGLVTTPNPKVSPCHTAGEWSNSYAFAILKNDGSVVTWGDAGYGGNSSTVASALNGSNDAQDVRQIFSTSAAFAALRADGSVVTWGGASFGGDSSVVASALGGSNDAQDVTQLFSTNFAFAALRADGSVITWGDVINGGNSSAVASALNGSNDAQDVTQIFSTGYAFAALRADGSVVTWGAAGYGGDSSAVASALGGTNDAQDVTQLFSTGYAFAALRTDGSVVTWGNTFNGGNSSAVASALNGSNDAQDVTQIFSTYYAFAAQRADGSVVTWGDASSGGDSSAVASKLNGTNDAQDVTQIFSTISAFAALRADGSVVTWGNATNGGDSNAVANALGGSNDAQDVTQIFSTGYAFAALRADGSVVTWGDASSGGDSSAVATALNGSNDAQDVTQIFSTYYAFAALRADGSVVTWGDVSAGGDSSAVATALNGSNDAQDVTQIFSTDVAFTALRADGSVVTWGDANWGGNSSAVSSQLTAGVVGAANLYTNDVYSSNIAPVFTSTAITVSYADTAVVDNFETKRGTLVGSDGDANTTLTYGIAGGTNVNALIVSKSNDYGTLTVNTVSGAYTFVANSLAIERLATPVLGDTTLKVTVSDGIDTTKQDFTVAITQSGTTESDGNDNLLGTAGADHWAGLKGDDTYQVNSLNDVITENANEGIDTVLSSVSYSLATMVNVENLTLTGAALSATGNASNNILTGNANINTLTGGAGNDTYYVDNALDKVIELAGAVAGTDDTVYSSANYILLANIENLILTGAAVNATGNVSNNILVGNNGANTLDGKAGADTMIGGLGSDTYTVDNVLDKIIEKLNEGTDSVLSSVSYVLSANVENLTLTGAAAINATGNDGDNTLTGNAANNILTGGLGVDTLNGGAGNDTLNGDEGADSLNGGLGKDTYNLTETTAATDTVQIAKGDSLVASYDVVTGFKLGGASGVDKLDLANTSITTITTVDGIDKGIIHSHHISNGIISFDNLNTYDPATPLTITATDLPSVFSYLQANITNGDTVAFVSGSDTFVFQDGGTVDTLVELVGVTATSLSTNGSAAGSVWIV